jgi:hypothetical protein
MKASELRIGNLVYFFKDAPAMVIAIASDSLCITQSGGFINPKIEEIEPIPLTEEWLLKFGFEKVRWGMSKYPIEIRGSVVMFGNASAQRNLHIKCKHVHQLQNLYFALTGEELKIEL